MPLRRLTMTALAVLMACGVLAATASPGSADPGGPERRYCSSWQYQYNFRNRACVTFYASSVYHEFETNYLGSGTVYLYHKALEYQIAGGGWTRCNDAWGESYYSGQYRTLSCSTYRVSGITYRTRGSQDDEYSWTYSPTSTG